MLKPEQIVENWNKLISIIEKYIEGDRKQQLIDFYNQYEERIGFMPASPRDWFHSAFAGGYVDHIVRVVDCAVNLYNLWEKTEPSSVKEFTLEELVFAAINHDLGKMGLNEEDGHYYEENDSDWHIKNMGQIYKFNRNIPSMTIPDRSLYILQSEGIPLSVNEYLGIKLHDGLYDESNKYYYKAGQRETKLRTSLPIILHHADHMASQIEFSMWDELNPINKKTTTKTTKKRGPKKKNEGLKSDSKGAKTVRANEKLAKISPKTLNSINSFFD